MDTDPLLGAGRGCWRRGAPNGGKPPTGRETVVVGILGERYIALEDELTVGDFGRVAAAPLETFAWCMPGKF